MTFQENRVEIILTVKIGQLIRQNFFQYDLIFVTSNCFILKDNTASFTLFERPFETSSQVVDNKFLLLFEVSNKTEKNQYFSVCLEVKSGTCRKYKRYVNKSR